MQKTKKEWKYNIIFVIGSLNCLWNNIVKLKSVYLLTFFVLHLILHGKLCLNYSIEIKSILNPTIPACKYCLAICKIQEECSQINLCLFSMILLHLILLIYHLQDRHYEQSSKIDYRTNRRIKCTVLCCNHAC